MPDVKIEESWKDLLKEEFEKPYFSELIQFVKEEYKHNRIFPRENLFLTLLTIVPLKTRKSSFWDKIPTTGRDRLTAFVFPYRKE